MRIALIVDEDPDLRAAVEVALTSAGWTCWLEPSAEHAFQRIRREVDRPGLVLIDVVEPEATGAFFSAVAADGSLPVVVVTGIRREEVLDDVPFHALLFRPFTLDELLATVEAACSQGRTSRKAMSA